MQIIIYGLGVIVEMDQSLFTRWTNNTDRILLQQLIFGHICKMVIVYDVYDLNVNTFIQQPVSMGIIIISNQWVLK